MKTKKPKKEKEKKKQKVNVDKTVLDILPIRSYDEEAEAFVLQGGTYMDLLEVLLKDRENASDDEIEYDILTLAKFYKVYEGDIKWISLNFPVDTSVQRENKAKILERTYDPVRQRWLRRQIAEMEKIDAHTQRRESYLQIFGHNEEEIEKNRAKVLTELGRGRGNIIMEMDKEKKITVIYKLSNMSSIVRPPAKEEQYYD